MRALTVDEGAEPAVDAANDGEEAEDAEIKELTAQLESGLLSERQRRTAHTSSKRRPTVALRRSRKASDLTPRPRSSRL